MFDTCSIYKTLCWPPAVHARLRRTTLRSTRVSLRFATDAVPCPAERRLSTLGMPFPPLPRPFLFASAPTPSILISSVGTTPHSLLSPPPSFFLLPPSFFLLPPFSFLPSLLRTSLFLLSFLFLRLPSTLLLQFSDRSSTPPLFVYAFASSFHSPLPLTLFV